MNSQDRANMIDDISRLRSGHVEGTIPHRKFKSFLETKSDDYLLRIGQNAVEWGNREDSSKHIRLSYCMFNDRVVFKIQDEGEGFDVKKLKDPSRDPLTHIMERISDGKRMGGYGIFMSKSIMDDIVYSERGNVVVMTKLFASAKNPRKKPQPGESSDGGG